MAKDIIFRGRRKDNGQWIEGNYNHIKRKGVRHVISCFDTNKDYDIYRESLQVKDYNGEFIDI